jgi:hypothetical protein
MARADSGKAAGERFATRKHGGAGLDLIVAGIGVAICIGYIAWRY